MTDTSYTCTMCILKVNENIERIICYHLHKAAAMVTSIYKFLKLHRWIILLFQHTHTHTHIHTHAYADIMYKHNFSFPKIPETPKMP